MVRVQVDDTGHYLLFEANRNGRKQMKVYYQAYNDTRMLRSEDHFNWIVHFQRRLDVKVKKVEEEKVK